jgi:chromosomal replication initiation ATPase DnaA
VQSDASGNGSTRVILGVPNGYIKDWLENRLHTPIRRTLSGIAGQEVEVEFRITQQTDLRSGLQEMNR